jgi:hypothetical protein
LATYSREPDGDTAIAEGALPAAMAVPAVKAPLEEPIAYGRAPVESAAYRVTALAPTARAEGVD